MSDGRHEEIECKFLDVNKSELITKLESLGAQKQFQRIFKRYVFDFPDLALHGKNAWLRVRDEGDRVTMAYKQRLRPSINGNDAGMKEVEVVVSDFGL